MAMECGIREMLPQADPCVPRMVAWLRLLTAELIKTRALWAQKKQMDVVTHCALRLLLLVVATVRACVWLTRMVATLVIRPLFAQSSKQRVH
eukprot:NODE_9981_length_1385_cov_4.787758.p8 GENE.NODE_9981_length_1385_cov_4.787758~~NODE_9981_length_1385_cov_4.787758.p8  ORF type:complete len:92 (+),score=3.46 NODE_9981_length_1385_cov_4.787758:1000-1275(+)